MYAEVAEVLGTGPNARPATLADYPNLKYTEQVFAESMRLYPPAWAMGRRSTKPVELGPYQASRPAHTSSSASTSCTAPPSSGTTPKPSAPSATPPKPKPPAPASSTSPSAVAAASASAKDSPGWKGSSPSPPSPSAGA